MSPRCMQPFFYAHRDLMGRCSGDAFPGSRAGRDSCNRDSLPCHPARPVAAVVDLALPFPRSSDCSGTDCSRGWHSRRTRPGTPTRPERKMHVACPMFPFSRLQGQAVLRSGRRLDRVAPQPNIPRYKTLFRRSGSQPAGRAASRFAKWTQNLLSGRPGRPGHLPSRLRTLWINACPTGLQRPECGNGSRPLGEHRVRLPLESRKTSKPLFLALPAYPDWH